MGRGSSDEILFGDGIVRSATEAVLPPPEPVVPTAAQELTDALESDDDLLVINSSMGMGTHEVVGQTLKGDRAKQVVICSSFNKLRWNKTLPKAQVVSLEWAHRHADEIKPGTLILDHPRGPKTLGSLSKIAGRAKRVITLVSAGSLSNGISPAQASAQIKRLRRIPRTKTIHFAIDL